MFYYGADYYPEHWPEERWKLDSKMMANAGFNVVRLAEFAWSKMEPTEGHYDFDWLDRAITQLSTHGIRVVLGTPTGSPPAWLMAKQQDLFLVDQNGIRQPYGVRREYCPNNPLYHHHTDLIVNQMVEHFKENPAIIGWQIDNEFGDRCYCDICKNKFQEWLEERYETLENLNERWGTVFWSHTYTDWSQISVPLKTIIPPNPGLALDYRRFMSDTYRKYQKRQIDCIRKTCPGHFITHNLMGFAYPQLNYYDMTADLDLVTWDNYRRTQWGIQAEVDPADAALTHDNIRGLKKQNFWVMEEQSGNGGWEYVAVTPKPGELRLWTYQSIAHGADGIVYFRWRTCRFGAEQFWHGILDHHGFPGRRYQEVTKIGEELKKIGEIVKGSQYKAQVAIMQSYDARFAFQVQPNHPEFSYENHIRDIYRGFFNRNIAVDIISEKDLIENYKVVVVPALFILEEATVRNLEKFAAAGGTVIFTPRTGVKDHDNKIVDIKLPGLVAGMAGVEVEEYGSIAKDEEQAIKFTAPGLDTVLPVTIWADVLKPGTAEITAIYTKDFYQGRAAITVNHYHKGTVIYVGTLGNVVFYDYLAQWICTLSKLTGPAIQTERGVEICERLSDKQRIVFVMNHTSRAQEISLPIPYRNLISGESLSGATILPAFEVLILAPLTSGA